MSRKLSPTVSAGGEGCCLEKLTVILLSVAAEPEDQVDIVLKTPTSRLLAAVPGLGYILPMKAMSVADKRVFVPAVKPLSVNSLGIGYSIIEVTSNAVDVMSGLV